MTASPLAGKTIRAQFYRGARRFEPGTAPAPSAGAGEALLRVRRVGICGTDLHIFEGHLDARVGRLNRLADNVYTHWVNGLKKD